MMKPRLLLIAAALGSAWAQSRVVEGVVLSNDAWPRPTTLREWTSDVMRISGAEKASETAQGKAFFEWLRLFSRMAVGGMIQSYEGAPGKEVYVLDAQKQLFVYGWGYCDTTSRIAEAAWQEYKRDPGAAERVITQHADGGYHTMFRLRMDGRHGAFDPRYGYYLVESDAPGARILDWAELHGRFEINKGYTNRSRPFFEIAGLEWERALLLQPAYFASEAAWRAAGAPKESVFGDGAYRMGTVYHDMSFALAPGMTITRYWDNSARKFYVPAGAHTKREWPFLASGRFYRVTETSHGGNWPKHDPNYERARPYLATVPNGEGYPADLAGGRTIGQAYGVIEYAPEVRTTDGLGVVDVRSPFVLVDGTLDAPPGASVEIRTLAPKPRHAAEPDQWSAWEALPAGNASLAIHGKYRFELRVRGPDRVRLKMKLYFENGIMSIPPLFAGRNTLRFRIADAAALQGDVSVSYRYLTAAGERTQRQVLRRGDFRGVEAVYTVDSPGLLRCQSVSIAY
jgi:hypothetical protein